MMNVKENIKEIISAIVWQSIHKEMDEKGFALISGLLPPEDCDKFIENYDEPNFYRKTITMERYRFGLNDLFGEALIFCFGGEEQIDNAPSIFRFE